MLVLCCSIYSLEIQMRLAYPRQSQPRIWWIKQFILGGKVLDSILKLYFEIWSRQYETFNTLPPQKPARTDDTREIHRKRRRWALAHTVLDSIVKPIGIKWSYPTVILITLQNLKQAMWNFQYKRQRIIRISFPVEWSFFRFAFLTREIKERVEFNN